MRLPPPRLFFSRIAHTLREWTYRWRFPEKKRLQVDGHCVLDDAALMEHIRQARLSGHRELKEWHGPHAMPAVIVGSGHSVLGFVEEIRDRQLKGAAVFAIKGAHDWLISNKIIPDFSVAADPQEERAECFRQLSLDTVYLMASQCHPKTWDYLQGKKVVMWHSYISDKLAGEWPFLWVVGGSTTGMRTLTLAYLFGFRKVELYGFDSCVTAEGGIASRNINNAAFHPGDKVIPVTLTGSDKTFLTCLSMVPQVAQIPMVFKALPGLKVEAHGEGYFQEKLRIGKHQLGWPV